MAQPDGDLRRMLGLTGSLAERTALSGVPEKVCAEAAAVLWQAADDLPFGLIYLVEHTTGVARVAGSWGEVTGGLATPVTVGLAELAAGSWPPRAMADRMLVLPFTAPGSIRPDGVLITGIADPRWSGGDHRAVVELIANLLGCAVAAARARSAERDRVTAPTALRELAGAGHALATSLNAREISRVVTGLLLPDHALWCAIWLVRSDDLGNDRVIVHHDSAFPAQNGALRRAFAASGAEVRGPLGVDECLDTQRAVVRPVTPDQWPDEIPELGGAIALTLPMRARGRIVGALTFGRLEHGSTEVADLYYLEELTKRAALAFDNAALYAAEQRVALGLQRSLLPRRLPDIPGLALAARYLPGARAGGDWYDLISLPDGRIGLMIGDVVGHGVQAAARMGQLRTALRSHAVRDNSPARVLEELDSVLLTAGESRFATCQYAVFDPVTGQLHIANAGHLPPLLLTPGAPPAFVDTGRGIPLGGASRLVTRGPAFTTRTVAMPPGSALVLYTDGLVEMKNREPDNGLDQLRDALTGTIGVAEDICDRALTAMRIDDDTQDDTTMLVLQRM